MKIWASLYLLTWLLFLQFWLALTPIVPPVPEYLHIALGLVVLVLAYSNAQRLRMTTAPARIKRIARATFYLGVLMAVLGVLVYFQVGAHWTILAGITVAGFFLFLHLVNAIAMITQSAATGLAYDMWEEREFERGSAPGEVPAAVPSGAAGGAGSG